MTKLNRRISVQISQRGTTDVGDGRNFVNFRHAFSGSDNNVQPPATYHVPGGRNAAKETGQSRRNGYPVGSNQRRSGKV